MSQTLKNDKFVQRLEISLILKLTQCLPSRNHRTHPVMLAEDPNERELQKALYLRVNANI